MKRYIAVILAVLMLLVTLTGCADMPNLRGLMGLDEGETVIYYRDLYFVIDRENSTIAKEHRPDVKYSYRIEKIDGERQVFLTLLNGMVITKDADGEWWGDDKELLDTDYRYDEEKIMAEAVIKGDNKDKDIVTVLCGCAIFLLGGFLELFPEKVWELLCGLVLIEEPRQIKAVNVIVRTLGAVLMTAGILIIVLL